MSDQRQPFAFVMRGGDVVRNHTLAAYKEASDQAASRSKELQDRFQSVYQHGLIEPLHNPETLAHLPEVNVFHYQSVLTKAHDTAGLGHNVEGSEASKGEVEEVEDFFDNLEVSVAETLTRAQYDYESVGWAVIEVIRENHDPEGKPVNLVHVPAHTVRRHRKQEKFAQKRGAHTMWFKKFGLEKDIDKKTGELSDMGSLSAEERGTEVLWWVNYTTRSDYYGLPDVMPALGAIQGDLSRRDYNIEFFQNHGVPAYAVYITGDFDPGKEDEETGKTPLETSLEERFAELAANPHSVMLMSIPSTGEGDGTVEVKFEPLATEVKEASFRMYRVDNRDEVLVAHGVPPYRVGIAETGSLGGSTAIESTEIYKQSVLNPRQQKINDLFTHGLIREGFGFEDVTFTLESLDTEDLNEKITQLTQLFGVGAVTPRQIIAVVGVHFDIAVDDEHVKDVDALDWHFVAGKPITGPFAEAAWAAADPAAEAGGGPPGQLEPGENGSGDLGDQAMAAIKRARDVLVSQALREEDGRDVINPEDGDGARHSLAGRVR